MAGLRVTPEPSLGGRFDRLLLASDAAALAFRARAAWAHDWMSDPILSAVFQTLPGANFVVDGALPAKNSALTSAGAELRLVNGVTLLAKFDGEFASHSSTYAGTRDPIQVVSAGQSGSPSFVRFGSSATEALEVIRPCTSASPRKRTNSRSFRYVRFVPIAS
jgi:hypothetical protein